MASADFVCGFCDRHPCRCLAVPRPRTNEAAMTLAEVMTALTPCPAVKACTNCGHREPIPEDLDWCHACIETYE